MAITVKYRMDWKDQFQGDDFRVDYEMEYSGAVIGLGHTIDSSFEANYNDGEGWIVGSEAVMSFYVSEANKAAYDADFYDSNYKDIKVKYYVNSVLKWVGWLKPENTTREVFSPEVQYRVSATDGLNDLKDVGYTGFENTGREAGLQIIKNAINFNGIDDLDFHIQCNLYEDALMSIGENIFVEIQGNNAEFYTVDSGETVPDDCYTVLEKIIKPYYCQLAQVDGYWSIINQQEYVSEYDIFDYSTLTQSTGGGAVDRTVSITSHYRPADFKFELSKNPAIKILRLLFRNKNLGSNEIATNPDFEDGGTPPAGWSNSGWDAFSTTTLGDGNKVGNTTESTTNSDSKYIEAASFTLAGVTTSEQDFVQSSFRVKIKSITFSSPGVRHPVVYAALVDPLSNLIPGNIASLSEVDGEFVVIEDSFPITLNGLYSLRLYVVPHATSPTSQLTYYWDDLNVVHSSTANTTTDSLYINTSASAGYQVIEEEIYFADSFQESDIGALNDGVTLTSSWTRYNKAPENLSLAYLFAQQYLNDRQAYHDLLRIDLFDIDETINFHSILVLDSKYYSFSEYSKNSKTKLISGTLKQVDNTSDVSFTFSPQTLLSKFGESSQTVEFDTIGFATQTWALSTFGSKAITEEISGLWNFTHASGLKVGGTGFTSTDIGNWNTAFGWGDHSTAGYVTSAMQNFIDDLTPQAGGHISMGANKIVQGAVDTLGLSIDDNAGSVTIDGGLTVTANSITKNGAQVATEAYADAAAGIQTNDSPTLTGNWSWDDDKGLLFGTAGGGPKIYAATVGPNYHDLMIDLVAGADMVIRDTTGADILKLLTDGSGGSFAGNWGFSSISADVINFTGNSTSDNRGIAFNNRTALSADYNDGFLRLNNISEFTNGVYTPGTIRADGGLFVDSSGRGIKAVTGSYGTVQTIGTGVGFYEGYNIGGNAVFMSLSSTGAWGLYDDTNNEWGLKFTRNAGAQLYFNGTEKLVIVTGGVNITGAVRATGENEAWDTSDIRLKEKIVDIDPNEALEAIKNWRTVKYWHKTKKKWEIGFIAQEVEKDYPEIVREDDNGIKMIHYGKLDTVIGAAIKALANG